VFDREARMTVKPAPNPVVEQNNFANFPC